MTKIFTFLILIISISLTAQKIEWNNAEDIDEYQSFLEDAQSGNKMLLVALFDSKDSSWQKMEKENIFSDTRVVNALSGFATISIPITSDMGSRWVQLFPAEEIPSFYILESDEFLLLTREGYQSAEEMTKLAGKAKDVKDEYNRLRGKYSQGQLTTAEWLKLLAVHSLNFPFEQTKAVALEFLSRFKGEELFRKDILPILTTYGIDLQTLYPKKVIQNRERIHSRMEDFSFEDYFSNVYSYNFDLALTSEDSIFLEKIITEIVPYNPDSLTTPEELALETRRIYAEETGQLQIWGKGILEYAEEIEEPEEKAEVIFDVAYTIADQYNSNTSIETAKKLAKKAGETHEDFRYTMLESYMNYLLENYKDAESLVRKAATQSDNPNNIRKAESLLQLILKEKPQEEESTGK